MNALNMFFHIHQSNLIEGINDAKFDKQGLVAWEYLEPLNKITLNDICKIQKINTLLQHDLLPHQRGYTRSMSKVNVYVGNHVAPSWHLVDALLSNWVLDMEEDYKTLTPKEMHIRFETIHPFVDGNGRTGRMLMWWHEIKQGKQPTLILDREKQEYYKWFVR